MTGMDLTRLWLPMRDLGEPYGLPLFCLPHAGGGASAFRTWLGKIPGVEVLPVQPPGRETRLREKPYEDMDSLIDDVAAMIVEVTAGRPYAVYGHSLGALTAFETVRKLREWAAPAPVHLVVSGSPAPQKSKDNGPQVSRMTQPQLVEMLRRLGGTPEALLADPELLQMILPAVRADFAVREAYRYRAEPPLHVPITVVASSHDPQAAHRVQTKWDKQTTAGFELHTLHGGHFAVFEQPELTHRHLKDALGSVIARL
jgi:surfactin synthase thioesterase subunit